MSSIDTDNKITLKTPIQQWAYEYKEFLVILDILHNNYVRYVKDNILVEFIFEVKLDRVEPEIFVPRTKYILSCVLEGSKKECGNDERSISVKKIWERLFSIYKHSIDPSKNIKVATIDRKMSDYFIGPDIPSDFRHLEWVVSFVDRITKDYLQSLNPNCKSFKKIKLNHDHIEADRDQAHETVEIEAEGPHLLANCMEQTMTGAIEVEPNHAEINNADLQMSARYHGLTNVEYQCYQNVCYRLFIHIDPIFRHFMTMSSTKVTQSDSELKLGLQTHNAFLKFLIDFLKNHTYSYDAGDLCTTLSGKRFTIDQMEDVCMYWLFLIDKLEEYMPNRNIFRDTLGFELIYTFSSCQNCSTLKTPVTSNDLILTISLVKSLVKEGKKKSKKSSCTHGLIQCMDAFFEETDMEDQTCETCNSKGFKKKCRINHSQKYLMIQLSRFRGKMVRGEFKSSKLNDEVDVPDVIDLSKYSFTQRTIKYKIYMVIPHVGNSLLVGHYFILVKSGESWVKFDDDKISESKFNEDMKVAKDAYVLIYERID